MGAPTGTRSAGSATATLADANLQDELFERGVSDSHVNCLDRAERALFFSRVSPLTTPYLVWKVLPFLLQCVERISPVVVLYRIEFVSLPVAILSAVCFGCGSRQSSARQSHPLQATRRRPRVVAGPAGLLDIRPVGRFSGIGTEAVGPPALREAGCQVLGRRRLRI